MSLRRTLLMSGSPSSGGGSLPNLVTAGQFLRLPDGTHWTAIQASDFNLFGRYSNGEDINPILQQRRSLGFNLLRVWTAYDIPGIGTNPNCDYSKIPAFVNLCAAYGLYVEFTAYTGINDPNHWPNLINASKQARTLPLLELVNELDQNSNEPDPQGRVFNLGDYAQPDGILTSHGSNGSEAWPVSPYWSYGTFHTNGASEWWRKNGHNAMEISPNTPMLTNESTRCPDNNSSVNHYYDAAAGAALLCMGSCFHSVDGKLSLLFVGVELDCAKAHCDGARSVDLRNQDGAYGHPTDQEGPDDLRVYTKTLDGVVTVHIRK